MLLRSSGGDLGLSASQPGTGCLEEDVTSPQTTDYDDPDPGQGYYYLVRGVSCSAEAGTYDTSGPWLIRSRDPQLQGASSACTCEPSDDPDADGFCSAFDNCPAIFNIDQEDVDGDGYGDACDCSATNPNCTTDCTDSDLDGFCVTTDCDDDPGACGASCFPGNPEGDPCDAYDNDCDLAVDEDPCSDGFSCTSGETCTDGVCTGVEECPPGQYCDPQGECAGSVELVFVDDGVYTGTHDTYIMESAPDTTHGAQDYWEWDTHHGSPPGWTFGLIRFDGIIGDEPERIPPGARVISASLRLVVSDKGAVPAGEIREALVDWNESTETWDTFGGEPGVQADEIGGYVTDAPVALGVFDADVTASVQAWADDPSGNRGWIFAPNSSNGVHVRSAEYAVAADRPRLTVQVVVPFLTMAEIPPACE